MDVDVDVDVDVNIVEEWVKNGVEDLEIIREEVPKKYNDQFVEYKGSNHAEIYDFFWSKCMFFYYINQNYMGTAE